MDQAAQYGTFVAAHAHGAEGIKNAVRAGVRSDRAWLADGRRGDCADEAAGHLPGGRYLQRRLHRDRRAGAEVARGVSEEERRDHRAQRAGFRKAVAAGVKIAYGTDSGVYPHGLSARQLPYMVRYGMTPMSAIQSATIVGGGADGLEGPGRLDSARKVRRHHCGGG